MDRIEELILLDEQIRKCKSFVKKYKDYSEAQDVSNHISQLYEDWQYIANCDYPMFIMDNGKKCDIKNEKKKRKMDNVYNSPSLDDIINRNVDNYNLVNNVLYDKNYASDQVNPYRKRK